MNKKTTLLGILGLVAVSGAGYVYTSGQASQLPQQIGQYLPETVRDYLPASFSPQQATEPASKQEVVQPDDVTPILEQDISTGVSVAQVDETESTMAESEGSDITPSQEVSTDSKPIDALVQTDKVEGTNDDVINDINAINDVINDVEESVSDVSGENMASADADERMKEIQQLEQELSQLNSKLGGLDAEKLELEDKFQNILKQNKTLAVKLKEIDDQLKVNMK